MWSKIGHGTALHTCAHNSLFLKFLYVWNLFVDKVLKVEAGKRIANFLQG